MHDHRYSQPEIDAVYRVIAERRDMRHFRPDPIEPEQLERLLRAAHRAPSVGLMQPWRFIRVTEPGLRAEVGRQVEAERQRTAEAMNERASEFMRLKVEGIRECGELLVVALCDGRERHVFGRRTMPEMDLASTACAIQNLWLSARAEGLGMGWVSMFDPETLAPLLGMPDDARPIAILCLGHVDRFYDRPMLEEEHWAERSALEDLVADNRWPGAANTEPTGENGS